MKNAGQGKVADGQQASAKSSSEVTPTACGAVSINERIFRIG
jgi:hypothetical protein